MATATKKLISVTVWAGTTQRSFEVATYAEAMRIVDRYHRNRYSPCFVDLDSGEELYDDGNGLANESGVYTC